MKPLAPPTRYGGSFPTRPLHEIATNKAIVIDTTAPTFDLMAKAVRALPTGVGDGATPLGAEHVTRGLFNNFTPFIT